MEGKRWEIRNKEDKPDEIEKKMEVEYEEEGEGRKCIGS